MGDAVAQMVLGFFGMLRLSVLSLTVSGRDLHSSATFLVVGFLQM